jgi:5-formyltetrahydrofolate cyclo-ligase
LLMQKWKTIVVPKIIENNEMTVIEYKSDSGLSPWKYWILEIDNWQEFTEKIDIAIIPWMAFTTDWKRLWRWKWYYDKFLWKNKKAYKIWICMPEQIIENIPVEKHDVIMDEIIY